MLIKLCVHTILGITFLSTPNQASQRDRTELGPDEVSVSEALELGRTDTQHICSVGVTRDLQSI